MLVSGSTKNSLYQLHIWCNVAPPPPQTALGEAATSNSGTKWKPLQWSVCAQHWHKLKHTRHEPPISPIHHSPHWCQVICVHNLTQRLTGTNWPHQDQLLSEQTHRLKVQQLCLHHPCFCLSANTSQLHGYGRNLTAHWFRLFQQLAPPGHFLWPTLSSWRAWIHTACLFLQVLHMQSIGWCGGCSQCCVILIRQD